MACTFPIDAAVNVMHTLNIERNCFGVQRMASQTKEEILARLQLRLMDPARRYDIPGRRSLKQVPRIVCANGVSLSVQTGEFLYCSPRENEGPWDSAEVGFPTVQIDALLSYAGDPEKPTDTVYGYVPLHLIAQAILDNGGFADGAA